MSDEFQHLIYESDAQIATITFNRQKQRNALSMDMLSELQIAVDRVADDDDVRVVILTGAGKGFCAGADIAEDPRAGDDAGTMLIEVYKPILARIAEMEKPVIAAVNGAAAGVCPYKSDFIELCGRWMEGDSTFVPLYMVDILNEDHETSTECKTVLNFTLISAARWSKEGYRGGEAAGCRPARRGENQALRPLWVS